MPWEGLHSHKYSPLPKRGCLSYTDGTMGCCHTWVLTWGMTPPDRTNLALTWPREGRTLAVFRTTYLSRHLYYRVHDPFRSFAVAIMSTPSSSLAQPPCPDIA